MFDPGFGSGKNYLLSVFQLYSWLLSKLVADYCKITVNAALY